MEEEEEEGGAAKCQINVRGLCVVVGKRTAFRRAEKPRDDEELDGGLFEIALSPSFRALPSPPRSGVS